MSVNYSLALMSSEPGNPDGEKKYYAKMQASGEVTMDEMAEDIAYATTLTDGDVLNALRALIKQVNKHLAAGKIVRLENFGSFQLQLQSEGASTEKEFSSANITGASIQFRPGKPVKAATRAGDGGLTFKRVPKKGEVFTTDSGTDDGDDNQSGSPRHYKIFCVNGNTGFRNESRIFYCIHLQNEKDYERKKSSSA